jgi:hypothetical protein
MFGFLRRLLGRDNARRVEPQTLVFRRVTATHEVLVGWQTDQRQLVVSWRLRRRLRRGSASGYEGVWRFRPPAAEWRTFWTVLDRIGVWNWTAAPEEGTEECEANGWSLVIVRGERTVQAHGAASYPFGFFTLQRALNRLVWGAVLGFWPVDSTASLLAAARRDRRALEHASLTTLSGPLRMTAAAWGERPGGHQPAEGVLSC